MCDLKCYDEFLPIIEKATELFSPAWEIDREKLDIFREYCDGIDLISMESYADSCEIDIDEILKNVSVIIECDEIIIKRDDHVFYDLIDRTIQYGFKTSDEGKLIVEFVFPPLWKKV